MNEKRLRADCARCAALCCVGLAFDRSEWFAFDKAAGEVCRHLDGGHRCGIHGELAEQGFGGCVSYECWGAGQRVTQEVFGGRSWRDDPSLLRPMTEAFGLMRQVQELALVLTEAGHIELSEQVERRRLELLARVEPTGGWTHETLAAFETSSTGADVAAFLALLAKGSP